MLTVINMKEFKIQQVVLSYKLGKNKITKTKNKIKESIRNQFKIILPSKDNLSRDSIQIAGEMYIVLL